MKIEDVSLGLRRLRRHLDAAGSEHPARWPAVLDGYDRLLLDAGQMLEIPTPSMARGRRLLTPEDRTALEQALAAAGLEVRPMAPGGAR